MAKKRALTTKQLGKTGIERRRKTPRGGPESIVETIGSNRLTLSGQVRRYYEASGLSVQELCNATVTNKNDPASGLGYQSVWRWARKNRNSSVRTLDAVAHALDLKVVLK